MSPRPLKLPPIHITIYSELEGGLRGLHHRPAAPRSCYIPFESGARFPRRFLKSTAYAWRGPYGSALFLHYVPDDTLWTVSEYWTGGRISYSHDPTIAVSIAHSWIRERARDFLRAVSEHQPREAIARLTAEESILTTKLALLRISHGRRVGSAPSSGVNVPSAHASPTLSARRILRRF